MLTNPPVPYDIKSASQFHVCLLNALNSVLNVKALSSRHF